MAAYGKNLDPHRSMRRAFSANGLRRHVVNVNVPSIIDEKQPLFVIFPKIGPDYVIVPGTSRVAFTIDHTSGSKGIADPNRTIVNNIGRSIVKTIKMKLG